MTAVADYPPSGYTPLVRGDAISFGITIQVDDVAQDISAWTWAADIRRFPDDDEIVASFTIAPGAGVGELTLSLDATDSALLEDGMGFDLEQLTPAHKTWWVCPRLRIRKDYTRT